MGAFRLLYRNKSLIILCFLIYLLLWFTISALRQSSEVKTPPVSPIDSIVSFNFLFFILKRPKQLNSTFYPILQHLSTLKFKLLLIDPYVLKHLFIDRLPFDHLNRELITFGLVDHSIEKHFPSLKKKGFTIKTSTDIFLDHVFIGYEGKIIHLAILHPYHSFYLIQMNTRFLPSNIQLSYGDKLRAIER